ncbi:MAG: MlaD family protein [Flavobacteriales bacterium]|jgi:phospholipid/cholesterol/gamma-HCH transport system substrate-binding protein
MKVSREFLIGVVVVGAIALLYIGINFLKGVNLFARQKKFYAVYENVAGIVPSNAVILNGYKIGTVSNVEMNSSGNGTLVVEVVINDANLSIPADTKLQIFDADLFGGKAIQIMLGDSTVLAENKDTLQGFVALGLTETIKNEIEPLKQKTSDLFATVDSVLSGLNGMFQGNSAKGLPAIFESVKNTMSNLENTSQSLNDLLVKNNPKISSILDNVNSISSNLKDNNEELSNVIKNANSISDSLAKLNLAATMLKVDRALGDFELILNKVNNGEGSLGQLVNNDSLHTELVNASHSLDLLLDDMRTHPKRYLSFSLISRRERAELSKRELEQIRTEIDELIKEKEAKGEK